MSITSLECKKVSLFKRKFIFLDCGSLTWHTDHQKTSPQVNRLLSMVLRVVYVVCSNTNTFHLSEWFALFMPFHSFKCMHMVTAPPPPQKKKWNTQKPYKSHKQKTSKIKALTELSLKRMMNPAVHGKPILNPRGFWERPIKLSPIYINI